MSEIDQCIENLLLVTENAIKGFEEECLKLQTKLSHTLHSFRITLENMRTQLEVSLNSKVPDPGVVSSKYRVLVNKNPLNDLETCTESNATEIRCQEQSKGGLKFDVILADPAATPPAPKRTQSPTRTKSVENIEEKLKAAEERRLSLEASKIASIAAKLAKIEEASKKKDEQTSVFITQTKEALDQKMETHVEKRDAYISAFKTKLKDHWDSVEKTRQMLEKQTLELRKEVEEKLQTASAQRDEVLKNTVDRLKEHEEQVKKVRAINKEKFASLESQIQTKLEQAEQRRVTKEKEQLEKLKSQERRAEMVRQNKRLSTNQDEQITASSG